MLKASKTTAILGLGAALAAASSSMFGKSQIVSKSSCVKGSPHATKRGPGRYHKSGEAPRTMNKLGRHLANARHVLSDFMRGKSPVGSKKKGGK